MAGINADLEDFRVWLQRGIEESGLKLKKQSGVDALGYAYELVSPSVFLHAYPNAQKAVTNLPSVVISLSDVVFAEDKETLHLRLTLGVWDSGIHNGDIFKPVAGTIHHYAQDASESYVKKIFSTTDLLTFVDVVSRHIRRAGREIGVDAESLTFTLVEDDELETAGFRFATADLACDFWSPPMSSLSSSEQAEDDAAPSIDALL